MRRGALVDVIDLLVRQRTEHNNLVKAERAKREAEAKTTREALNARIAAARAELAKVDRFLAAEKPRGQRGGA